MFVTLRRSQKEEKRKTIRISSHSNRTVVDANLEAEIRIRPKIKRAEFGDYGVREGEWWVKFLAQEHGRWCDIQV